MDACKYTYATQLVSDSKDYIASPHEEDAVEGSCWSGNGGRWNGLMRKS
jgi:hypothetical protein